MTQRERAQVAWSQQRARERVREVRGKLKVATVAKKREEEERRELDRHRRRERIEAYLEKEEEKKEREVGEWKREVRREGMLQEKMWRENENGGGPLQAANAVARVTGRDRDTAADFDMYLDNIPELKSADFVKVRAGENDDLLQYTRPASDEVTVLTAAEEEEKRRAKGKVVDFDLSHHDIVPTPASALASASPPSRTPSYTSVVPPGRLNTPQQASAVRALPSSSPSTVAAIKSASRVIELQQKEIKDIQSRVRSMQEESSGGGSLSGRIGGGGGRVEAAPVTTPREREMMRTTMTPDSLEKMGYARSRSPPQKKVQQHDQWRGEGETSKEEEEQFNLVFHIYAASNLPQPLSSCNAYCAYKLVSASGSPLGEARTGVCKNTVNPIFEKEKATFRVKGGWDRVEILVYSKNVFISDEFIGKAVVRVGAEDEGGGDYEVGIENKGGETVGTLRGRVERSWFAVAEY